VSRKCKGPTLIQSATM